MLYESLHSDIWAIMPTRVDEVKQALDFKAQAKQADVDTGTIARSYDTSLKVGGGVAIVSLHGILTQKESIFAQWFGGTSTERFIVDVQSAIADTSVQTVVIDVNSQGGSVYGVHEASTALRGLRSAKKKIVAIVNSLAASAAYWIASAANEILITPGGEAGSIGILGIHADYSRQLENDGVKLTIVHSGRYKTEGSPYTPLTDEALAAIQKRSDEYYAMFVGDVAANRGVTVQKVENDFGQGRVLGAQEAVKSKMADAINTLPDFLQGRKSRKMSILRRAQEIRKLQHSAAVVARTR